MTLVLSGFALSHEYRAALERTLETSARFETLGALRSGSLRQMLRVLSTYQRHHVLLAFEDEASRALQPILHLVALATLPRSIGVVQKNGSPSPLGLREAITTVAGFVVGSARGQFALIAAQRQLSRLRRAMRIEAKTRDVNRVLYVNANLWFGLKAGGSIGHMTGVTNALARSGLDVDLAAVSQPRAAEPVYRIDLRVPPFGAPAETNHYRLHEEVLPQLLGMARNRPYSFIYQRQSVHNFTGVILSRRLGLPLVVEYNGSEVWAAQHWGRPLRYGAIAKLAEDVMLRHAHVVVTVSDVLRVELLDRGVEARRIACYPNCVDPLVFSSHLVSDEAIRRVRRQHRISDDAVVVTFVGTFGRWHGVDVLAAAIARLADSDRAWLSRRHVRFLIVGDGARMQDVVSALGASTSDFVRLTGLVPQEQVPTYLAASDVLISPHVPNEDGSPFFGSPTKLFEYMAMARAIVASDLGQIGAVLRPALNVTDLPASGPRAADPNRAILVRPASVDDLIAGIRFAVERPDWRISLAARARDAVIEHYTWDHHVRVILNVLSEVAAKVEADVGSR